MLLERRELLRLLGLAAGATGLGGCGRVWSIPDSLVELALRGPGEQSERQTICGLCESGCGLTVRLVDGLPVGLKGNGRHPLNRGGACPVGLTALDVLYAPDRLRTPLRRAARGEFLPATWEEALEEIAHHLASLREAHLERRLVVLSDEPGQLFSELVLRFAHAFGSPNVAPAASSGALPFLLTQGLAETPGFDLARADLVLSFGLDLFEDGPAPLHAIAALVGMRATEARAALIHVGTRLSPSAAKADQFVAIRPGTHAAFALGVAHVLVRDGRHDRDFVAEHTFGFDDWTDADGRVRMGFRRLLMEQYYPDRAAQLCGCDPSRIVRAARRLGEAATPLVICGGEALWGSNATTTGVAVHALNALVGAFGRPGGVVLPTPIPLTPLPPLPAGEAADVAQLFAPREGVAALAVDGVTALAERVLDGSYPVGALLVVSANPVHEHPAGELLRRALERIPLVVALTPFRDETAACAHFVLPAPLFLEAWQAVTTPPTVGFSVLGVSQPVVKPLFDTRHPADVLLELARRLGPATAAALPWADYPAYLKQRLGGLVASGQGALISGSLEGEWVQFLEERGWRFLEHGDVAHFFEDLTREAGWWNPVVVGGDWERLFKTPSGRYEFFSQILERHLCAFGRKLGGAGLTGEQALHRAIAALGSRLEGDEACLPHYEPAPPLGTGEVSLAPFRPITARGRLGMASPTLQEMFGYTALASWENWVELAPQTAADLGLGDGDEVAVESARGSAEAVVRVAPGSAPETAHLPLGLGHGGPAGGARIGSNTAAILLESRDVLAGTPSLTSTRVRLRLLHRRAHGEPLPDRGGSA